MEPAPVPPDIPSGTVTIPWGMFLLYPAVSGGILWCDTPITFLGLCVMHSTCACHLPKARTWHISLKATTCYWLLGKIDVLCVMLSAPFGSKVPPLR